MANPQIITLPIYYKDTLPTNVGTYFGNTWTTQSLHSYTHASTPQARARCLTRLDTLIIITISPMKTR